MKYISVEILKHKTHKSVYHTRRHTHIRVLGSVTTDHLCLFHEHLCFNITSAEDLNTWLLESLIIKPSGSRFQMFPENVFFFFTNKVVTKCLNKKKKVFSTTFKLFLTFNNFILVQISKDWTEHFVSGHWFSWLTCRGAGVHAGVCPLPPSVQFLKRVA